VFSDQTVCGTSQILKIRPTVLDLYFIGTNTVMSGDQSSNKTSLKDLKETFDFFDSDDSQTITRQELEYVVLLMGGRHSIRR
jgi:hypothetical protein